MADIDVNMTLRAYDYLSGLFLGDAPTPGVRLRIDHRAPLTLEFSEGLDVAEVSFNRYVVGYARGDDSLIGLPAFILRGFRHRNFFVRRESPLRALADLRGKRVGTNSWPDTGTMWARAAMRDAGVEVEDVKWVIGTLDAKTPNKPPSPNDAKPPADAQYLTGTENLLGLLADGKIDAVTTAFAPEEVFQKDGWIRRLLPNYPEIEADYHRRTGVYPGFHIIAARRSFAEKSPQAVMAIYNAMRQSFDQWVGKVKKFGEASPWTIRELEVLLRDFPQDMPPFGMESAAHQKLVATICHEQYAQKLVASPANPLDLFRGFEALRRAAG
jgi:4,5-dihydroxyphthalate decarboxylase